MQFAAFPEPVVVLLLRRGHLFLAASLPCHFMAFIWGREENCWKEAVHISAVAWRVMGWEEVPVIP